MEDRKYAVVTGASSGIGLEIAKLLVKKGYYVILAARRKERLLEIQKKMNRGMKKECCDVFVQDLSDADGCEALFNYTKDKNVEILVNNAGFGDSGYFEQTDAVKEMKMIDLNVKSMHYLMKKYLQKFRICEKAGLEAAKKDNTRRKFYILNIASSAGLFPAGPFMATYYATKAYVTSLTRAVREELKKENSSIYVGALCPGPVDTEFNDVAEVQFALKGISARACAMAAVQGMFRGKGIIVPTLRMKMAVLGAKIAPSEVVVHMTGNQQKKKMQNVP